MIPENVEYAFLDAVFEDTNGNPVLYEIVFSTSEYETSFIKVDFDGLKQLSAECVEKEIISDFFFKDNFLRCNSQVRRLVMAEQLRNSQNVISPEFKTDEMTFFKFAMMAEQGGFLLLGNDDLVQQRGELITTSEVRPFSEMQFSRTTMSVYFKIFSQGTIYNRTIVYMENGALQFRPFYFVVPMDSPVDWLHGVAKSQGLITINNVEYRLFFLEFIPLYLTGYHGSPSVFNRAYNTAAMDINILKVLDELISLSYDEMGHPPIHLTWVGGDTSHKSDFGVYFDSSIKIISQSEAVTLLNKIMREIVMKASSAEEIEVLVQNTSWKFYEKLAAICVGSIMHSGAKDPGEIITATNEYKEMLIKDYFYAGLYTHKARTQMFFERKAWIASSTSPMLVGSDLKCFTCLKGGTCYGS